LPVARNFLKGQWDSVAIASAILLAFSFVFGGASQNKALRLALVELAALPLLVLATGRLVQAGLWREHRFALSLLAALVAVPLLQLIPLPPTIWTALPGRDQMALALELAGLPPGWSPLSLAPEQTWRAALALTPASLSVVPPTGALLATTLPLETEGDSTLPLDASGITQKSAAADGYVARNGPLKANSMVSKR